MSRTRPAAKGRRNGHHYSQLIHAYFESEEYAQLSPRAVKALIDVYCQYRGTNNGDLCAAMGVMAKRGWTSKDQLSKAIHELLETRWLIVTRQGGRRTPTLYAVTFMPIDPCGGKLDIQPRKVPLHLWKRANQVSAPVIPLPRSTGHSAPPHGAMKAA